MQGWSARWWRAATVGIVAIMVLVAIVGGTAWLRQGRGITPPSSAATATLPADLTTLVNPLIGTAPGGTRFGFTGNSGDVFPGAAVPLGMVQWSPDTTSNLPGGYAYADTKIKGFSLTHFSGRGCTVFGDFPFIPFVGPVTVAPPSSMAPYTSRFSHLSEDAHPGSYRVHLDSAQVTVELTATARTGLGRFSFPASRDATILIDAGGSANGTTLSDVTIDPVRHEVRGDATSVVGCGAPRYTVAFVARFDRPFARSGVWSGAALRPGVGSATGTQTGAYLVFDTTNQPVVQVQVGISFLGVDHARQNLDAEEQGFDFAGVRRSAHAAWNSWLHQIEVSGGTAADRTTFYTALYHTGLHPNRFNDANGDYLGFDGQVHTVPTGHNHYENIPGWDIYRTLIPLRAMLTPEIAADIAQSLVDDAVQGDGHLPRWEQANADSLGMNGDSADIIIADIAAYGGTGFDTASALKAMLAGQPHVREGLAAYLKGGYVPAEVGSNSADVTLEYSADDFAISRFAASLGEQAIAATYLQRSGSWRAVFNPASGYVQPRQADGNWVPGFQPASENGFQEGSSAQYTWMIPFDMRTLLDRMGGNAIALERLDTFFTKLNDGPASASAFMGNEPSFGAPWVYDFAGAPARTQATVRRIQTTLFKATSDGLPGNDDAGSLSAWYVFSALGLYPAIPGVAGFVMGSPMFPQMIIHLGGGQVVRISAPDAANDHPYVAGLRLNSQPTTALWLPWEAVRSGATLDIALASTPTAWGSSSADAPPSFPSA